MVNHHIFSSVRLGERAEPTFLASYPFVNITEQFWGKTVAFFERVMTLSGTARLSFVTRIATVAKKARKSLLFFLSIDR